MAEKRSHLHLGEFSFFFAFKTKSEKIIIFCRIYPLGIKQVWIGFDFCGRSYMSNVFIHPLSSIF